MERMTSRDEDCVLVNGHALGYATIGELVQMAERLAAYEDMDSKRLRPGDTVWLSKMFYTRPKKPVPVTVDAIRCASTGSAIPVTIFSLSRQKNTTSTLETTKMPDEYISRAKALEDFEACNAGNPRWTPQRVKTLLLRQPAADVAPVVRCRDCKHRTEYGNCGHPRQKGVLPSAYPYDFCSYGDRRVDHLALEAETTQIIDGCCTACGAFMDCCEAAEYKFCPYCAKRIV